MASRWMRRKNSSSLHSGDGVRPRSFHLAISLSSMKLLRGDVGIVLELGVRQRDLDDGRLAAEADHDVRLAAALGGDEPVGVTAATPSLSASNWAVAVTSSLGRRSRSP